MLPTRAWELAAGSLLVLLPLSKFAKPELAVIALASVIIAAIKYNDQTAFPGTAAIIPVLGTSLLIISSQKWPLLLDKLGDNTMTQWLGQISYPLYLWHWPVLVIPSIYWARPISLTEKIVFLSFTVFLADLTHRFVEQPLRYVRWENMRTFKVTVATTTALILTGTAIFFSYSNMITISKNGNYSLDEILAKSVNFEDGCNLTLGQTVSPLCEYGDINGKQTLVLYGDSHAAHWLPALNLIGRENNLKIVSLTKSACPAAEVIKEVDGQYSIEDCQEFRDESIARIAKIKPLAVISTGLQPPYEPYSTKDGLDWWIKGEEILYERLKPLTNFPIYLTDTPFRTISVPDCLAAKRGATCDEATRINPKVARGFITINPTPWLCGRTCPAVIDGIVSYRDHSHLTIAMSEHLATKLFASLKRIGVL
jgi:hypothetical protein